VNAFVLASFFFVDKFISSILSFENQIISLAVKPFGLAI